MATEVEVQLHEFQEYTRKRVQPIGMHSDGQPAVASLEEGDHGIFCKHCGETLLSESQATEPCPGEWPEEEE